MSRVVAILAAGAALGLAACVHDVALTQAPAAVGAPAGRWVAVASGTTRDLRAVWGAAPDDVWAVGDEGTAIHWDGARWSATATGTTAALTGVWASGPADAWAVGAATPGAAGVVHWDGARWSDVPMRDRVTLRAVWGSGAGDVWAVGGGGPDAPGPNVWRRTGTEWRPEGIPGARPSVLTGVGGRGLDDLWIVGPGPQLYRRARGEWALPVLAPRGVVLGGDLCVASDGAVWATGVDGAMHRYREPGWTTYGLAPATVLRGVWCGNGDDVWGVGDGGRVAHWDGTAWSTDTVSGADLAAVWDSDAGERWAVGARGTVLRFGP